MYLAALVRRNWFLSTYFADVLGVVGGGGSPQNKTVLRFQCFGQKMTGQKMSSKKQAVKKCPVNY
jgi:hypothetical protein